MKINQSILLDFTNNCIKKKNSRTGVVHNSFYNSTIPSVYHIRAMESAKYVTVIYCGTGQKYGQKRFARFLIPLVFLRGDFFWQKTWRPTETFWSSGTLRWLLLPVVLFFHVSLVGSLRCSDKLVRSFEKYLTKRPENEIEVKQ